MLKKMNTSIDLLSPRKIELDDLKLMFEEADTNKDGCLSYDELKEMIMKHSSNCNELSDCVITQIMKLGDIDGNGYISWKEFLHMIHKPQYQKSIFFLGAFIVIPNYNILHKKGSYEKSISCKPFPWFFILISIIQVFCFLYDYIDVGPNGEITRGRIFQALYYNHKKKHQMWRFFTYLFLHIDWLHLSFNTILQLIVGIPLEMVHKQRRVLSLYLGGVLTASLWTSIIQPETDLAGSSGGVYALMTAHLSALILNWRQMDTAWIQLIFFFVAVVLNVLSQVYKKYLQIFQSPLDADPQTKDNTGYTAHIFGALAGILLGLCLLRNFEVQQWEKKIIIWSEVLYVMLIGSAVIILIVRDYY